MNIGNLLRGAAKILAPIVVSVIASKAQREIDRQADKLIRKTGGK